MKRIPRKKKKADKKDIILYDLASLPKGATIGDITRDLKKKRIIVWSSEFSCTAPRIVGNGNPSKYKIIDIYEKK